LPKGQKFDTKKIPGRRGKRNEGPISMTKQARFPAGGDGEKKMEKLHVLPREKENRLPLRGGEKGLSCYKLSRDFEKKKNNVRRKREKKRGKKRNQQGHVSIAEGINSEQGEREKKKTNRPTLRFWRDKGKA